jgi:transposase
MSEDQIIERGERLAEELAAQRRETVDRRWRCPHELRRRVVAYAVACSADGESHTRIAGRVGLKQRTLSRWLARWRASDAGVHRVAIVPAGRPGGQANADMASELRLVTPHGFVVEGLDLERLASLLSVLG